jgi:hypothetical protein
MNKYLHPGHFFLGSHRSTHDSGVQRASYSSFKTFVRSPRGSRPNARMPTMSERTYVTPHWYVCCVSHATSFTSSVDCRCVESSPNDVIIFHIYA